jgi:arylsulfatase A-like enzyme
MQASHILKGSAVALTLTPLFAAAATKNPDARRPNIVLVLADQWRAKSTGYDGNPAVKTPNLDRLAGQSLNFHNTVSVCPVCTPYRASLMTGRFPLSTGMIVNDLHLPAEELCMAEIFAQAGYETAYIGKWHLDGYGRKDYIPPERRQGWDYWKASECSHHNVKSHYYAGNSDEMLYWDGFDVFPQTRDAQQYIRDHSAGKKPFLLMLSYGPPHPGSSPAPEKYKSLYPLDQIPLPPNVPPDQEQTARKWLQQYYALCTMLDECIGELLKTLDETAIAKDTIFVFTSDHGGMLCSHGKPPTFKKMAWDEAARVPFLLRYPSAHGGKGRIVETPLTTPDILATLLGLAGVTIPPSVEGESMASLVTQGGELDRAALYMSPTPWMGGCYRAIRTSSHTFIRNLDGSLLLFNDRKDPFQLVNLAGNPESAPLLLELSGRLDEMLKRTGDGFLPPETILQQWGLDINPNQSAGYTTEPLKPGELRKVISPRRSQPSQSR